jgi:CRP/FNR family transcriptional regulator, cyclic AMP receptor protein
MMPKVDFDLLREVPLFELLDDQELEALAQQLEIRFFVPNQVIFTEGEPGGIMYLVQRGRVEIYMRDRTHQRVSIGVVESGEIFGELSLLDNASRSTSAKSLDDTTVLLIDRNDLLMLVRAHPAAALDMISMLGKRIRETDVLVRNRVVARNVNEEMEEDKPTLGERLSDFLTLVAGDIRFVYFNFLWFAIWIVVNLGIIPGVQAFDPFPFGLLTMIVSLEAIFLSLFVLISQNRQAARDKVRDDIEYDVNIKAELEIRDIQDQLEELRSLMVQFMARTQTPLQPPKSQFANDQTRTVDR